ncbi:hypothetical protein TNCV_4924071 [Trichonephila clavipes]|nr:hypothetical protein TNCV_4924071 [Trichonephila clavipes]
MIIQQRKPRLVGENIDNNSCREDDEPEEGTHPLGVAEGCTNHCTPERVVHARGCTCTFFDCGALPPSSYISRKWIGNGTPVAWTSRFLNLNPFDFFFWAHLKPPMYETSGF